MLVSLLLFCIAILLYIFANRCRKGHPGLQNLQGWNYAHRGLHGNGIPENSMAAFRAALEAGYGIELDIHLLKDGNLAIIHDSSLKRTTGCDGCIEDLTTQDLHLYHLEGTEETIPTFQELLDLYAGKAPLIVELKAEKENHAALAEAACAMLETYPGVYCLESFDPRCIYWLKKHRPHLIRGQLSEKFTKSNCDLPLHLRICLTHNLGNFLTLPDFTAYKFADRKNPAVWICRKIWGAQGVSWTLKTTEDHATALNEGWLSIFEGFRP